MNDELARQLELLGEAMLRRTTPATADDVIDFVNLRPLARRRGKARQWFVFGGAATAFFLGGVGTTAAVNSITAKDIERGLPGAAQIFEGTGPSCDLLDSDLYLCTLDRAPAPELLESGPGPGDSEETFVDRFAVFVDDGQIVTGGCASITSNNLGWLCASGNRAVEYGYLPADLLGTRIPGIGVG